MRQRIVVDTNVLVSAIRSADGAAREVLRRCLKGDVEPLIGNALFLEYEDVLSRDGLFAEAGIDAEERSALLDALLSVCRWTNVTFLWRPNLPDEADNHLIELAVAGNADWIITRNTRDVVGGELRFDSLGVATPGAWLQKDNV